MTAAFYVLHVPPLAYALPIPVGVLVGYIGSALRAQYTDRRLVSGLLGRAFQPQRFPGTAISATAAPMFVVMIGLPVAFR